VKFTEEYLSKIPFRKKIRKRLEEIFNYIRYGGGIKAGDNIIFTKNDGLQNQPVYYIQKGLNGKEEVLIDPNKLSGDGLVSIGIDGFSKDKRYMAYHENKGGSDWETIYIMDLEKKEKLSDKLEWIKFGGAAWRGDGFYYSRYSKPEKGKEFLAKNEYEKIYYHKLGEEQEKDMLIYEDRKNPLMYVNPQVTEDESYLIVYKAKGTEGTEVWYQKVSGSRFQVSGSGQGGFKLLFKGFKYNYGVVDNVGDKFLVYTNNGAGNYRVVLVDPKHPEKENWKDVIAEKSEKLQSATTAGGKLFAEYLKDASSRIEQYNPEGKFEQEVKLPGIGSASSISGDKEDSYVFYSFSSYTEPPSIYRYEIATGKSEVFKKPRTNVNTDDYMTEEVFYPSKDGTKIHMFIVHKKGLELDGERPTLLYGYGGFNVSLTPNFNNSVYILLEKGGVYAVANIRGGGEYGEKWHKSGELLNKQNVFDDFIAGAEYLIKNKYTNSEKLAINGGSNGGLLVGACMIQRPDLFKAALPEVGVMDMLRFQKFTVGWGWTVEYGSSDSLKYFEYLYRYSPLHNLKPGTEYPATMVITADHDDRVVPGHSFKFAAALQSIEKGGNPALIRIETMQGHGASGMSLSKYINKETDKWTFLFYNLGEKY
jgi:prolyl oligopeptidase